MESASDIMEYMLWLVWSFLVLTPANLKNPGIGRVISSQNVLEKLMSVVSFAPGILDAVQFTSQPSLAFFKSLPTECTRRWGVYLLVLERKGRRPMIYVGSGTNRFDGVSKRLNDYVALKSLPSRIGPALEDGYTITHKGLLCWTGLPNVEDRHNLRALFLAIETAFSVLFWALEYKTKDYGLPKHLCPWEIGTLDYHGLCSHAAITEAIRGENEGLTVKQLEEKEAAILQRQSDMKKARYYGAKERDFDAWKATRRMYEAKRDPEEKRESNKRSKAKAKAEGRFKCETCNIPFEEQGLLNTHNLTKSHIDKVNGVARKPPKNPEYGVWAASNLALKKHFCRFCNHNTSTKQKLEIHFKSLRHKNAVAKAKESSTA